MNDRSSQTQHSDFSQLSLADIIAHCQEERRAYRLWHITAAPWCMELFRRAFAGDQEAWQALRALSSRSCAAGSAHRAVSSTTMFYRRHFWRLPATPHATPSLSPAMSLVACWLSCAAVQKRRC